MSTGPLHTTTSQRSTPPRKAATHPLLGTPSRPETPTGTKTSKQPITSNALVPSDKSSKPTLHSPPSPHPHAPPKAKHHHLPHTPRRYREPVKSLQTALRQTAQFGELLSPVKSVAGGFVGALDGGKGREERREEGDGDGDGEKRDVGSRAERVGRRGREVGWADVKRERERRVEGEANLHRQFTSLSAQATALTRHLDYTYYSLLSSLPSIAQTLSLLRDLAAQSQTLLHDFTTSAVPSLEADISSQISILRENHDKLQSEQIAGLESRMRVAREKVDGLGERVRSVRARVEAWEARERDEKRRGKRRVGILWGVLGTLLGLFVVVVVVRGWYEEVDRADRAGDFGVEWRANKALEIRDALITSRAIDGGRPSPEESRSSLPRETWQGDDFDARLRMLDEL